MCACAYNNNQVPFQQIFSVFANVNEKYKVYRNINECSNFSDSNGVAQTLPSIWLNCVCFYEMNEDVWEGANENRAYFLTSRVYCIFWEKKKPKWIESLTWSFYGCLAYSLVLNGILLKRIVWKKNCILVKLQKPSQHLNKVVYHTRKTCGN